MKAPAICLQIKYALGKVFSYSYKSKINKLVSYHIDCIEKKLHVFISLKPCVWKDFDMKGADLFVKNLPFFISYRVVCKINFSACIFLLTFFCIFSLQLHSKLEQRKKILHLFLIQLLSLNQLENTYKTKELLFGLSPFFDFTLFTFLLITYPFSQDCICLFFVLAFERR